MTTRTKPVRIFESDDNVLTMLAGMQQRGRSEVIHAALAEYVANHRGELSALFADTQRAIASGDIEAIARVAAASLDRTVDALVDDLPT